VTFPSNFQFLIFGVVFSQTDDKIASTLVSPGYLKHVLLAICMGEDKSVRRMRHALPSNRRKAWVCLHADRLGLRLTDTSTPAMLSGVRTEDGRPGDFLQLTEPSLCHYLTHQQIAFGNGASCWFCLRRNPRWVSVIDPVPINSSTALTHSYTPTFRVD